MMEIASDDSKLGFYQSGSSEQIAVTYLEESEVRFGSDHGRERPD